MFLEQFQICDYHQADALKLIFNKLTAKIAKQQRVVFAVKKSTLYMTNKFKSILMRLPCNYHT